MVIPFMQESIRNSADKMLLTAPDSLVVSLAKYDTHNGEEGISTSKKGRALGFGIDALDMLNFTYKVCTKQEQAISAFLPVPLFILVMAGVLAS
jgi:DNA primase catalytic subunit